MAMGLTIEMTEGSRMLHVRLSGLVDFSSCREIYQQLLELNPDHLAQNILYDLSEVEDIDLTFEEMNGLIGLRRAYYGDSKGARIAIFAPTDTTFGMSRMYSSLLDQFDSVQVEVFRTHANALAYLDIDATASQE
ncbi:MAG: hypothetical protein CMF72_20265 [Mameliella sp.]|nr:hypothetical protein [Mameliella sp.]|tara:strand:- start:6622 stop:7026 length:405 start_codon:yes stop_codon:yes gene_type:complete